MRTVLFALAVLLPSLAQADWVPVANIEGCQASIYYPRPHETATWSGSCLNGKIDGEGVLSSSNGLRLEGQFRDGMPVDAKGRVSILRADGRRMAASASYAAGVGSFSAWTPPREQVARYVARLIARIRPNIVFPTEGLKGNPLAVVRVKTLPDGKIESSSIVESSGMPDWDQAVLRALAVTATLPFDEDGTLPQVLEISFRPKP